MKRLVPLLVVSVLPALLAAQENSTIHPAIPLLDGVGQNVLESGQPVSLKKTCGGCHDTNYIEGHSFHVGLGRDERTAVGFVEGGRPWDYSSGRFGRWDPLEYRYLTPPGDKRLDLGLADWVRLFGARHVGGGPARVGHDGLPLGRVPNPAEARLDPDATVLDPATGQPRPWDWEASGTVEMNCFLCHIERPDNAARIEELAAGRFDSSGTATLANTGIVKQANDGWQFDRSCFDEQGAIEATTLGLGEPRPENCGLCHGQVHTGHEPLELDLSLMSRSTATTGGVFSGQRMSDSAVNLADKQNMGRSWDVHAERLVGCTDCHFSLNNPVFRTTPGLSGDLTFDPRRSSLGEYLVRPSHQFAKGTTAQGATARHLGGTMRRCNDCHHAQASHRWLPYQAAHFAALSCEACHVPHAAAPAIESIDWTLPSPEGEPVVTWRGIQGDAGDPGALVTGFRPVLMPRQETDGTSRLVPCNLITASFWVDNGPVPRPIRLHDLQRIVTDGTTDLKVVRTKLVQQGYVNPEIRSEVQPYEIHHGVVGGRWATRSCDACHSADSVLTEPMTLATALPGNATPQFIQNGSLVAAGDWNLPADKPAYQPSAMAAGYYVLGHDGHRWIDVLGILMLLGVVFAVIIHGGLRVRHALARRAPATEQIATKASRPGRKRKRIYTTYERTWHWVQTLSIVVLLATGFHVHSPVRLPFPDLATVVWLHNVVGFLFIGNAFLGLFYYLTTGAIQHYVPERQGLAARVFAQMKYYTGGIFRGETHPTKKTPERRLNPLQQLTYLALLNVLLPLQVVSGLLMWGASHWPQAAGMIGGLTAMGAVHTLGSYLFFSFLIAHLYLITMGHTLLSNLEGMATGYEELGEHEEPFEAVSFETATTK